MEQYKPKNVDVKFSCREIDDMQNSLASWMEKINMQEIAEEIYHHNNISLTKQEVIEGYDILMANLYFLDVLRCRIEKLRLREESIDKNPN